MSSSSSYSWMPGWLRKFLNLDDEMPNYGPGQSSYGNEPAASYTPSFTSTARPAPSYAPPVRTAATYTPPALPPSVYEQASRPSDEGASRPTPSFLGTQTPEEAVRRFSSFSSAPPSAASPINESGQRPVGPPPLAPRPLASNGEGRPISEAAANGFVQPLGYGVRSFVRGALPPQGLEQFTREFRATMTDVWNFYTYWIRFETEDLVGMGRESIDALTGMLPPLGESAAPSSQTRRIKVSQSGNGNGEAEAKRPAPPAPTAVFSPTVTADDAAIPPQGKDTTTEFTARMAKEAAPAPKAEVAPAPPATVAPVVTPPATPPAPSAATPPTTPPNAPRIVTPPTPTPPKGDQSKGGKGGKR